MTQPTPETVERVKEALSPLVNEALPDLMRDAWLTDLARAALAAMPSLNGAAMREATIRECADYLEGYAGGHYMAKSCAAALRALLQADQPA